MKAQTTANSVKVHTRNSRFNFLTRFAHTCLQIKCNYIFNSVNNALTVFFGIDSSETRALLVNRQIVQNERATMLFMPDK